MITLVPQEPQNFDSHGLFRYLELCITKLYIFPFIFLMLLNGNVYNIVLP